jgi:hypothetical protein
MTFRASRRGTLLYLLCLVVLSSGCARRPSTPANSAAPLDEAEIRALLEDLERQEASVQRYRGLVRVRGRGPEGSFDVRLAVFFQRPGALSPSGGLVPQREALGVGPQRTEGRLRVELLGAFGGTHWSAVANEDEITAYFPSKKHYLREPAVEEVVERLLGIRLGTRQMMAALSGSGFPAGTHETVRGYRRGSIRVLELGGPERTLEIGEDGQVLSARAEIYRISYPTSWKSRGRLFPDELRIESQSVRARLETSDVDVNVALEPDTFVLDVPADARRLRLAEIDGQSVFVLGREPG